MHVSYVWFLSFCTKNACGRDEVNQMSICGINTDIWNVVMDLALGWFLIKVFWNCYAVTSTNYTPNTAVTLDYETLKR